MTERQPPDGSDAAGAFPVNPYQHRRGKLRGCGERQQADGRKWNTGFNRLVVRKCSKCEQQDRYGVFGRAAARVRNARGVDRTVHASPFSPRADKSLVEAGGCCQHPEARLIGVVLLWIFRLKHIPAAW